MDEIYPVKAIVFVLIGFFLNVAGIVLSCMVAPRRGDGYGYIGLFLVVSGFLMCGFAGVLAHI